MAPTVKWINSFDVDIEVDVTVTPTMKISGPDHQQFHLPGDKIHARLKQHENAVRAREQHILAIIDAEQDVEALAEEIEKLEAHPARDRNQRLNTRKNELARGLIKYLFLSTAASKFTDKLREKFISALAEMLKKSEDDIHRIIIEINDLHLYENDWLSTFIQRVDPDLSRTPDVIQKAFEAYKAEMYPTSQMSVTPSKQKTVEVKVLTYLKACEEAEVERLDTLKQEKAQLEEDIKVWRAEQTTTAVSENLVVANIGFVITCHSESKPGRVQSLVIDFPVTVPGEIAHTIYDQFNASYNYLDRQRGGNQIKRNSLIDAELEKQEKGAFNKQLDYHSERDLYVYMQTPEFRARAVERLQGRLTKSNLKLKKVHYIVLDMHSSRYMCGRCQTATESMQSQTGPFLRPMVASLNKAFQREEKSKVADTDSLRLITRVSADIVFGQPKVKAEAHEPPRLPIGEQAETILAMDSDSVKLPELPRQTVAEQFRQALSRHTLFASGEDNKTTHNLRLAYNDTAAPIRTKAASAIQGLWKAHHAKPTGKQENVGKQEDLGGAADAPRAGR